MEIRDIRLGGHITLSGEVHEMSMLTPDDKLLPEGVIDVRLRVVLAHQGPSDTERSEQ